MVDMWDGTGGDTFIPHQSRFCSLPWLCVNYKVLRPVLRCLGVGWSRESAGKEFMVTMCPSFLVVFGHGGKDVGAVCGLL